MRFHHIQIDFSGSRSNQENRLCTIDLIKSGINDSFMSGFYVMQRCDSYYFYHLSTGRRASVPFCHEIKSFVQKFKKTVLLLMCSWPSTRKLGRTLEYTSIPVPIIVIERRRFHRTFEGEKKKRLKFIHRPSNLIDKRNGYCCWNDF